MRNNIEALKTKIEFMQPGELTKTREQIAVSSCSVKIKADLITLIDKRICRDNSTIEALVVPGELRDGENK